MQDHQQTARQTLDLVEQWVPERNYRHESRFQNDLQEYLDRELNGSSGMGMQMGGGKNYVVEREHGRSNGDVVVDGAVGIELKRDLSNSQTKKLRGQIESYREEYDYVIVCACGIDDMSGWRNLQNKYEKNNQVGGFGVGHAAPVRFVGKDLSRSGSGSSSQTRSIKTTSGNGDMDEELAVVINDGIKSIQKLRGESDELTTGQAIIGLLRLLTLVALVLVLSGVILQTVVL